MGQLMSLLLSRNNMFHETFMISYLSQRGVTPYNLELIPGGDISKDEPPVLRHKFKEALKRQTMLDRALREVQRGELQRCMSPCFIREFSDQPDTVKQDDILNGNVTEFKWKRSSSKPSRSGFGNLERLVSDSGKTDSVSFVGVDASSEEIVAYDVVRDEKPKEPLRGSLREKRARSRPEPSSRRDAIAKEQRRQSMSVTQVSAEPQPRLLSNLRETSCSGAVERIQPGNLKRSKRAWPSTELLKNTLKDPKTRPTSYFLARFHPAPDAEYVEVDYCFYKTTGKDSFRFISGSLEDLLQGSALASYVADVENNNDVDEKTIFFKNFPTFFSTINCRIWWNGFLSKVEGSPESRMHLKGLTMDPPAFIFDMSGLRHISATRNDTRLSFVGTNNERGEGEALDGEKKFLVRGRTEQDVKLMAITHVEDTTLVSIALPTLSGIPVSTKSSGTKAIESNSTKSEGSLVRRLKSRAVVSGEMQSENGNCN